MALVQVLAVFLIISTGIQLWEGDPPPIDLILEDGPVSGWDQTTFTRYRNLNDTENELRVLSEDFSSICALFNLSSMFPYPNGTPRLTVGGRTLWGLKISDNPHLNESDEPDIIIVAMTHAREWISNEVAMFTINYILRNYGLNETIDDIVNGTEIWVIPVLNPDGFQHSIDKDDFNNSYGIYGWRKNTNESNGVSGFQDYGSAQGDGVDLNRNLGYKWGQTGSSSNPNSPTYRGTSAFSEAENQILRDLSHAVNFTMALSYHSYSGLNLYPWGHTLTAAPDQKLLHAIASKMTEYNGYTPQSGAQLYTTSGDFTDYFYGTFGIPAFTVEINHRNSRFIPEISKISEDVHLNIEVSLLMAKLASDPFSVFESGINGSVADYNGDPVANATVTLTGTYRSANLTTDSNGSFFAHLPDGLYMVNISASGGLFNNTTVSIPKGKYLNASFVLIETIPPVIEAVEAYVGDTKTTSVEKGSLVRLSVREKFNEQGLSGKARIVSDDYSIDLELKDNGTYEAYWDTTSLKAYVNYSINVSLTDPCGNTALAENALTLSIIDTTPPIMLSVRTYIGPTEADTFERGDMLYISVNISDPQNEDHLDVGLSVSGAEHAAYRNPKTLEYATTLMTQDMHLGEHVVTANAQDPYGNRADPISTSFFLVDTEAPRFTSRLLNPSPFVQGDLVGASISPIGENISRLVPVLEIQRAGITVENVTEHEWNEGIGGFQLFWNSTGADPGLYRAVPYLIDDGGNKATGIDMAFELKDLTPPDIISVLLNGDQAEPGSLYSVYEFANITVVASGLDPGSTCEIEYIDAYSSGMGTYSMDRTGESSFSILFSPGYGTYGIEIYLRDASGNLAVGGLVSGTDLTLTIERNPLEIGTPIMINLDTGHSWVPGETGYVLAGEALDLICRVENLTGEDLVEVIVSGRTSVLESVLNGSLLSCYINSSTFSGTATFHFRITLEDDSVFESGSIGVYFGRMYDAPVMDLRMLSYQELSDGSYRVNFSMAPMQHVTSFVLETSRGTSTLPAGTALFYTVMDNNDTLSIRAVYRPFPRNSMRNDEFESASVSFQFKIDEPIPPLPDDEPPDDGGTNWIAAIVAALLILAAGAAVLFLLVRRKRETIIWED